MEKGLDFRATKDIDLVLIIEAVDIRQLGLVDRTKEQILEELKEMYIAQ